MKQCSEWKIFSLTVFTILFLFSIISIRSYTVNTYELLTKINNQENFIKLAGIGGAGIFQRNDPMKYVNVEYLMDNFNIAKYGKTFDQFAYPVENPELTYIYDPLCEFTYRANKNYFHVATDIVTQIPDILAIADGEITETKENDIIYGNYIIVKHANNWYSKSAHLSFINVKEGQFVTQTQKIGVVGDTGNSIGIHLHLEIWQEVNGKKTYYNFLKRSLYNKKYYLKYN